MSEERDDILVLVDEKGEEVEFEYLDTMSMNGSEYAILLPLEEDEDPNRCAASAPAHLSPCP